MVCVKNYHAIHTASTAVTTSFDTYALWRHEHFIDKYSKCNSCCLVMTKLHNDQIHSNVSNKLLTSISQIIICKYAWRVWKSSAFSDGGEQSGLISPLAAPPFNLACLWQSLKLSWALMAALSYPSSKQYAQHWWGSRVAATCYCLLNFVLAWYVVYNIVNTIYQETNAIINFTVFHYGFGCTTGKLNLKYMIPLQYLTTLSWLD